MRNAAAITTSKSFFFLFFFVGLGNGKDKQMNNKDNQDSQQFDNACEEPVAEVKQSLQYLISSFLEYLSDHPEEHYQFCHTYDHRDVLANFARIYKLSFQQWNDLLPSEENYRDSVNDNIPYYVSHVLLTPPPEKKRSTFRQRRGQRRSRIVDEEDNENADEKDSEEEEEKEPVECEWIMKTGKNKGSTCGKKVSIDGNTMCTKHQQKEKRNISLEEKK